MDDLASAWFLISIAIHNIFFRVAIQFATLHMAEAEIKDKKALRVAMDFSPPNI
jgi:hypothetical protein